MYTPQNALSTRALVDALSIRDLTDPEQGPHALQLMIDAIVDALIASWACDTLWVRSSPIVSVEDCYDRLGYAADAISRDARYARYVSGTCMLRSHTSASIPSALRSLRTAPADLLVVSPGVVYRRDSIDRLHTGTPHQLDLWRISTQHDLHEGALQEMIAIVVEAALPGARYRCTSVSHPYTTGGRQIDVSVDHGWVEVGECGRASTSVLEGAGIEGATGLAMGMGLDRLLMIRKGVPDIRLLRSADERVASQMSDLEPYRAVSRHPSIERDLSMAVDGDDDVETIGDRVREALGEDADAVETVEVIAEVAGDDVPEPAARRLGLLPGQKNILVRVSLRPVDRTLTKAEANRLRDRVYDAIHQGTVRTLESILPRP